MPGKRRFRKYVGNDGEDVKAEQSTLAKLSIERQLAEVMLFFLEKVKFVLESEYSPRTNSEEDEPDECIHREADLKVFRSWRGALGMYYAVYDSGSEVNVGILHYADLKPGMAQPDAEARKRAQQWRKMCDGAA